MRTKSFATAVLVFDELEVLDVAGPVQVLTSAGRAWNFRPFKLDLVGETERGFATRNQLALKATKSFSSLAELEVLIIPGGYGARLAAEHAATVEWVRRVAAGAVLVASVGNGTLVLAKAGLLAGAEVAIASESVEGLLAIEATARPNTQARTCAAGKIISARASAHGLELGCEIVERLFGKKLANGVATALGIDGGQPPERIEIVPGAATPGPRHD
jgi:transcriptional regulator GlxA family with amidase domain